MHDADHRHLAGKRRELAEGVVVQSRHDGHVDVAGPAATALGKEHDRQLELVRQRQHPVLLVVVAHALGSGQDRVVIGQHDAARFLRPELPGVDRADAGDQAVRRRVGDQVFHAAAPRLGGHGECTVLGEGAALAQVRDVLARGAAARGMAPRDGLRPVGVEREGVAIDHALQVGAYGVGIGLGLLLRHSQHAASAGSITSRICSSPRYSPGVARTSTTRPLPGACSTCSIFIASSTAICAPAATRWPATASSCTSRAAIGARTIDRPVVRPLFLVRGRAESARPDSCSSAGSSASRKRGVDLLAVELGPCGQGLQQAQVGGHARRYGIRTGRAATCARHRRTRGCASGRSAWPAVCRSAARARRPRRHACRRGYPGRWEGRSAPACRWKGGRCPGRPGFRR